MSAGFKSLGRMLQSVLDPVVKRFLQIADQNMELINDRVVVLESEIQPDWRDAELQNSWVEFGTLHNRPQFYKTTNGLVSLRGLIKSGTTTADTVLFVLPEDYRTENRALYPVITNTGIGRLDVLPNGEVRILSGGNGYFSLDGIEFYAYR